MTDTEARALGQRWIAAGGGWAAGMLSIGKYGREPIRVSDPERQGMHAELHVPDLRDPATRGAALEIVRERIGCPVSALPLGFLGHGRATIPTGPDKGRVAGPDGWGAYGADLFVLPCDTTEEGCLVSALETSP